MIVIAKTYDASKTKARATLLRVLIYTFMEQAAVITITNNDHSKFIVLATSVKLFPLTLFP
jgi:hypothetical protein